MRSSIFSDLKMAMKKANSSNTGSHNKAAAHGKPWVPYITVITTRQTKATTPKTERRKKDEEKHEARSSHEDSYIDLLAVSGQVFGHSLGPVGPSERRTWEPRHTTDLARAATKAAGSEAKRNCYGVALEPNNEANHQEHQHYAPKARVQSEKRPQSRPVAPSF